MLFHRYPGKHEWFVMLEELVGIGLSRLVALMYWKPFFQEEGQLLGRRQVPRLNKKKFNAAILILRNTK